MKKSKKTSPDESVSQEEDIIFDPEADSSNSLNKDSGAKFDELRRKLKSCQAEKQEYLLGWQRAKADYVNLRQENEKERGRARELGKASLLEELIPLADSFEMAMANASVWQSVPENWRLGVEYIYRELQSVLTRNGVSEIFPLNLRFNPEEHESVATVEVAKPEEDDLITEVIKKGYKLGNLVLRPAQVKVGSYRLK